MNKCISNAVQALLDLLKPIGSSYELGYDTDRQRLIVYTCNQIIDDFGYKIVTRAIINFNENSVELTLREEDYCIEVIEAGNTYWESINTEINMEFTESIDGVFSWHVSMLGNDSSNRAYELRAMIVEATKNQVVLND